ncbi:MAG: mucoidy inhibitor MuiA family protein [Verrucomicrobia bacterium]|nr:mucoidy inhibitor MuiA family protein [Verrucomicrobiota bacterium]
MKLTPTLLLLAAALGAAEVQTDGAPITRVTVYADRAEVVRTFKGRLEAGEQTLVFDRLPGATRLDQLRVEGRGEFTLLDIRPETVQTKEIANAQVRALQDALKAQDLRQQALNQTEARLTFQKSALDKMLARLTTAGKESANPEMDPLKWAAFLDFQDKQLAEVDRQVLALQADREAVRAEVDRLNRELAALRGNERRSRLLAKVNLDVRQAGEVEVHLSYLVRGPSWSPSYDMRADTKAKTLDVTYRAEVRQATGEDWRGVSLRLSTAQPGLQGREPRMDPWFLTKAEPMVFAGGLTELRQDANGRAREGQMFNDIRPMDNRFSTADANDFQTLAKQMKAMEQGRAQVQAGGTAATFVIERPSDILADNKPAQVTVMRDSFPAYFRHTCVPKLSPFVFLKTKAVNKTDFTFLPGPTAVFLDGAFVAQANLDLVPSGQDFWTYLGVDQGVSVERKELARREESSGVFGKKTLRTVFDQVFKLKNGKATDIELVLWDQVPASNHEDIKVVFEEPRYEKDTDNLKMNESKFLEWRLPLKAGAKQDLPFRFAVERPEDVQVVGL